MTKKEKNISIFNKDVKKSGSYLYTNKDKFSAYLATKRQTDEIVRLMKNFVTPKTKILDVGCGDGTYTFELLDYLKPKLILGFDLTKEAILAARRKIDRIYKGKIFFQEGNIYDIDKITRKNEFDIVVLRGVLHHLYNPKEAVHNLSKTVDKIVVLEPNGLNPILKLIEKTSSYHKNHEEKSYLPPTIDKWFSEEGYKLKYKRYFSIVPYFCPDIVARFLKSIEPFFEKIPILHKIYCGSSLALYVK